MNNISKKITLRQLDNILCIVGTVVLMTFALDMMQIQNGEKFETKNIVLSAITYICAVLAIVLRTYIYFEKRKKKANEGFVQKVIEESTIYVDKLPADIELDEVEIKENAEEYMEENNEENN